MVRQWETTETRKKQIVDAAFSIMADQGITALSIEQIAKSVGVSPSAIYRHFASRERIIDEVLQELMRRMDSFFVYADQQGSDPTHRIYIFFRQLLKNVFTRKILPEAMLTPEFFSHEQHRRTLLHLLENIRRWVQGHVEDGQATGSISQSTHADKFWIFLFGTIRAFILLRELSHEKLDPEQHCVDMWQMIAKMLAPDA